MKSNYTTITPTNSSPDLTSSRAQQSSQSNPKLYRRSSVSSAIQRQNSYATKQHRLHPEIFNADFLIQRASLYFSTPMLIETLSNFFLAVRAMEEEIMLPSRLKDMPVEELVFDNSVQPDSWHDIYTFVREMQNQLQCTYPFSEDDDNSTNSKEKQRKRSNDDEGIIIPFHENSKFSSAVSIASSDGFDHSSTSSGGLTSYEALKDELKYHYYALSRTLDNLTFMTNRVTEKYREESTF